MYEAIIGTNINRETRMVKVVEIATADEAIAWGRLRNVMLSTRLNCCLFRWYEIVTTFRSQQIETNGIWMCYHYLACHESMTRKTSSRNTALTFKNFENKHKFIRNKKRKNNTQKVIIACIMRWQQTKNYVKKWMLFVSINAVFPFNWNAVHSLL